MAQLTIGVFGGSAALVDHLRRQCPGWTFLADGEGRDAAWVVILDVAESAPAESVHPKVLVRIVLDGPRPPESDLASRRPGELHIEREAFLRDPHAYLAFACDAAGTMRQAAQLQIDKANLTEIRDLMSLVEAEAVSKRVTLAVLKILGLPAGTLLLHDPRLERYVVSFTNDAEYHDTGEFLPGVPADLLQQALSAGTLMAVDPARRMAVMALQVGDDLIGVIKVPLAENASLDEGAVEGVTSYLASVTMVLGNVYQLTRSRDLAMRDDLTKAFNRRFFESYLDEEIERSRRYGSLFSIIFLDLDDLKMVNNFYGHLTGSRTLQEVAKRILGAVRGIDKVVRFGGDEFCIILPQTDQHQAVLVANRVRKAMTCSPIHLAGDVEISITASFGIASYPLHAITKEDLIRQADEAMYRVKSTTKNAVGIATVGTAEILD